MRNEAGDDRVLTPWEWRFLVAAEAMAAEEIAKIIAGDMSHLRLPKEKENPGG